MSRGELEESLWKEFESYFNSEELKHYRRHKERIAQVFKGHFQHLKPTLKVHVDNLENATLSAKTSRNLVRVYRQWSALGLALVLALSTMVLNVIIADISNSAGFASWLPPFSSEWVPHQRTLAVAGSVLLAAAVVLAAASWRRVQLERGAAQYALVVAENKYDSELQTAVREEIGLIIGSIFKEEGLLLLPTLAPTLVEVTSSKIIPSETHDYVRDFITSHDSSAIGVAGERGAGKSTLMRAVVDDEDVAGLSIYASAPVHYDPVDFTRRLFAAAAEQLLRQAKSGYLLQRESRARRARLGRYWALGVLLYAGGALIVFDYYGRARTFGASMLLGIGLVLYVVIAFSRLVFSGTVRSARPNERPFETLAGNALDALDWEIEQGEKESLTLTKGFLQVQGEASETRRRRASSHPDLVKDFREMLTQFSRDRESSRFVIVIDELDKLSTSEDLIEAINGLKDLFHIPNVHFLVSVSTDALASFEARGVPTRDAFDSAFDSIVSVERLRPEESQGVISARAPGFPIELAYFCHAWSGGLPRDLLRVARRCVELQRQADEPRPVFDIVREIVIGDLESIVQSESRRRGPESNSHDLVQILEIVRGLQWRKSWSMTTIVMLRRVTTDGPVAGGMLALTEVAVATLRYFASGVLLGGTKDAPTLAEDVAVIGRARSAVATIPGFRAEFIARAFEVAGLTASETQPAV